ncbi:MAG: hypothetical protein IKO65_10815 [Victivallales bacterium]|nr:hypothetical protein [Victivallales bacterium]
MTRKAVRKGVGGKHKAFQTTAARTDMRTLRPQATGVMQTFFACFVCFAGNTT